LADLKVECPENRRWC